MPIWKLTPLPTDSTDWNLSIYRGEVVVRAKDEREARHLATQRFGVGATVRPGKTTPLNPWRDSALVSCKMIQDHDYQDTGPAEVLSRRWKSG